MNPAVRARDECGGELVECRPVGQREGTGIVELVFGMLVGPLPASDPGPVVLHDAVADGLLQDPDEDDEAVLYGGPATLVGYPRANGSVYYPVGDHPDGR